LKKEGSRKSSLALGDDSGAASISPDDYKKLQDELAAERQERSFFQLERVYLCVT
jgi:hypothetical protein